MLLLRLLIECGQKGLLLAASLPDMSNPSFVTPDSVWCHAKINLAEYDQNRSMMIDLTFNSATANNGTSVNACAVQTWTVTGWSVKYKMTTHIAILVRNVLER